MDRDLTRQLTILVTFVATVVVDGPAVALPRNGLTTAQISDPFPVLVMPADDVFTC